MASQMTRRAVESFAELLPLLSVPEGDGGMRREERCQGLGVVAHVV